MLTVTPHQPNRMVDSPRRVRETIPVTKLLTILVLCSATCGCGIVHNFTRNLIVEPWHYATHRSLHKETNRNRQLAKAAWADVQTCSPGREYSVDYARGFEDGFTDFLTYGGNG